MVIYLSFDKITSFIKDLGNKNNLELSKVKLPDFNPNLIESPKDNAAKYSFDEKDIKRKFREYKAEYPEQ